MKHQVDADLRNALALHQPWASNTALHAELAVLSEWCLGALRAGGKILFAGNGASFADAQHLAGEFVSRLQFDRAPLRSIALATNSSSTRASGNDYGYGQVFARELRALGGIRDVSIPITTRGNSPNILAAVAVACELSVRTMGFTGENGGANWLRPARACGCPPREPNASRRGIFCWATYFADWWKAPTSRDVSR